MWPTPVPCPTSGQELLTVYAQNDASKTRVLKLSVRVAGVRRDWNLILGEIRVFYDLCKENI